ncbi:hypothetical protein M433DRAFT_150757 [Acidomyces richmondensis BFW]|nr:MAG: hypothetical protein FE78DRAFT_84769 [Acidomyces sp. 'richmondensis']KYG48732.1 hypothetical protein M433DRAFT_150757 [Acidomyces richmondensis BFW]
MPTKEAQQLLDGSGGIDMTVPPTTTTTTTTTTPPSTAQPNSVATASDADHRKKRKRTPKKNFIISRTTIRNPPWAYIHLQHLKPTSAHVSSAQPSPLDAVTAHLHLKAALSRFLGLHGEAISIDILKLQGNDVWIRVPAGDKNILIAAVGGWVSGKGEGWRVKGTSSWDARAWSRDGGGQDLFHD